MKLDIELSFVNSDNDFIENLGRIKKIPIKKEEVAELIKPKIEDKDVDFAGSSLSDSSFTIYNSIVRFVKEHNRLPKTGELLTFSNNEIKNRLALSKYIVTNEAILIKNKLVDSALVERARDYFDRNKIYDF